MNQAKTSLVQAVARCTSRGAVLLSCVGLIAMTCSPSPGSVQAPVIAARETVFRSQSYALPLDPPSRADLLLFLSAGGNRDGIEEGALITVVYPDAEQRWGQLLQLMSQAANVDVEDLSNGSYATWFKHPAWRHVVDAREERPNLACPPFAFSQERFEWIFHCGPGGKLQKVYVQLRSAERTDVP